jgi:hypothetical protein
MIFGFAGINIMRLDPEAATPAQPLEKVPMVVQDK